MSGSAVSSSMAIRPPHVKGAGEAEEQLHVPQPEMEHKLNLVDTQSHVNW